jgi:AcrR family transcriptional regulator
VSPLARRTQRADEARERGLAALLDAAEELVGDGTPYGELAVEAIARRAGFSRATFYAYFPDKRALALAIGERVLVDLEAEAAGWLEAEGEVDLRPALEGVLGVFKRHRAAVSAVVESATYDEQVGAFWREMHERFITQTRDRIRRDLPELGADVARARAFVLVWGTERSITEHLAAPRATDTLLVDALELQWRAAITTA